MEQILDFLHNNAMLTILGAVTLIQVTPIKINPWTWICKQLGRMLNGEIVDMFEKFKADAVRYRIIRFDDEIRHNERPHTEEHYNQIISDIDYYEDYCSSHKDYPNEKAVLAVRNIKERYRMHKDENSFLV